MNGIEELLLRHRVLGCSIAFSRAGSSSKSIQFGWADGARTRSVDAATCFHLYSGTKLHTATALMLLVERGRVSLDARVREYLPELDLRRPITIRQLASHASGLPDTLRGLLGIHFPGDPIPTTAAALSKYRTSKGGAPGAKAAYRNVNYAILGELISRVSGVAYRDFVRTEVLEPLGAGAAAFEYRPDMLGDAAEGTIARFSPMRWLLRFMMPGVADRIERGRVGSLVSLAEFSLDTAAIGGLIGRPSDFLPLAVEFLSAEDGLLSAASKRDMLTLQSRGKAGIASTVGVGLGWKRGHQQGVEFWNHEGGGAGFTSETRIYPADQFAIVIMMNATQSTKLSWLAHEIAERLR